MRRELIDGFENRFLFLAVATSRSCSCSSGSSRLHLHGTKEQALLVQEGATVRDSGSWALPLLAHRRRGLDSLAVVVNRDALWARARADLPGGVVLLIAAMQGAAVSDLIDSLGREDLGLGPGVLGSWAPVAPCSSWSSALACLCRLCTGLLHHGDQEGVRRRVNQVKRGFLACGRARWTTVGNDTMSSWEGVTGRWSG